MNTRVIYMLIALISVIVAISVILAVTTGALGTGKYAADMANLKIGW